MQPPREEVSTEVDPFVKRVVTIKASDHAVVIFKYQGRFRDQEQVDALQEKFEAKMNGIPFVVIDDNFDLTVLKRPQENGRALIA